MVGSMRALTSALLVTGLVLASCGDDGGTQQAFCDLVVAIPEDGPSEEDYRALVEAAPDEIAGDLERVLEPFVKAEKAAAENDQEAFQEATASAGGPAFQESAAKIEAFVENECGIDPARLTDGPGDVDDSGDSAEAAGDEFDFVFVGVPGTVVRDAAGVEEIDPFHVDGTFRDDGSDFLLLGVIGIDEDQALDACQRVAERIAEHPDASGEGALQVNGAESETAPATASVTTRVSPGDPGECRPGTAE